MGVHGRVRTVRIGALAGLAVGLAVVLAGPGSVTAAVASPADPGLGSKLSSVLRDSRTVRAKTSAVVLDATDGRELYARYASTARMPASNMKIVTAAAAMHTLGPTFRFKTELVRRGSVVNGVVQGNLYLKGYGDPTTRESDYASLAAQLAAAGITGFTGKLIVDSSYFDSTRYNPGWSTSYADDYYAAEITAVTIAPNSDLDSGTIYVKYKPGSRGKKAVVTTYPAAAAKQVKIVNTTVTAAKGSGDSVRITRAYASNTIKVAGRVALGRSPASWQITAHRPDLVAAAVLRAELAKKKIRIAQATFARTMPSGRQTVLATDTSIQLKNLLKPFLKYSNNMHAEALTKAMGAVETGQPGSWANGLPYTLSYLRSLDTPMAGVKLVDGSGLSRGDRLTARALGTVLLKVQDESWFDDFAAALPVAGNTTRSIGGTLRHRMTNTRAADNALAKTGTLTGVTALSGYVTGRDGRRYIFSLISNYSGSSPRPVENTFVVALANWRR